MHAYWEPPRLIFFIRFDSLSRNTSPKPAPQIFARKPSDAAGSNKFTVGSTLNWPVCWRHNPHHHKITPYGPRLSAGSYMHNTCREIALWCEGRSSFLRIVAQVWYVKSTWYFLYRMFEMLQAFFYVCDISFQIRLEQIESISGWRDFKLRWFGMTEKSVLSLQISAGWFFVSISASQ